MPAQYLGQVTVGGALPGFSAAFSTVGGELQPVLVTIDGAIASLGAVSSQLVSIGDLVASLGDTVLDIKAALRVPVGGDVALQVGASQQAVANLGASVANPAAYVSALISGATQAIANLGAVPPLVKLQGQLAAATSVGLVLQAKVAAIDIALAALDAPAAQLTAQGLAIRAAADAIDVVIDGLQLASAAVSAAITSYTAFAQGALATAGAYAFYYTGTLGGLGAAIDLVTPSTGISAATQVAVPILFVQQSDTLALQAVQAVYLTS